MNNLIISVKRFLSNKNTVTILGVIIILAIIYFGYNAQIKKQTTPIQIPVAKMTIQPRTKITSDMIDHISVPSAAVTAGVIRYDAQILNKYSNYNTVIPEGSMFFGSTLVTEEELPNSAFVQVKEGEVVYNFPVTMASTYGNSMMPGTFIDIYMKAENEAGLIMVGKLVENIEILAVKDSAGRSVFENTEESRTPSTLIFGVKEDIHLLLRKAQYMTNFAVVLIPVPHGGTAIQEGETQVSTEYLRDFINANTVNIPINELEPETDETDENNDNNDEPTVNEDNGSGE